MEKRIPFGGVGSSIAVLIFLFVLLSFFIYLGFENFILVMSDGFLAGGWDFWGVIGTGGTIIIGAMIYFYPSLKAANVSDRIEELERIRESEGLFKDVVISHKYFWIIFIVNIFFAYTLIAWLVLFFWAHAPGTVKIPELVANKIFKKEANDEKQKRASDDEDESRSSFEKKLKEVQDLLDKGLLTEEEAASRRAKIISEE